MYTHHLPRTLVHFILCPPPLPHMGFPSLDSFTRHTPRFGHHTHTRFLPPHHTAATPAHPTLGSHRPGHTTRTPLLHTFYTFHTTFYVHRFCLPNHHAFTAFTFTVTHAHWDTTTHPPTHDSPHTPAVKADSPTRLQPGSVALACQAGQPLGSSLPSTHSPTGMQHGKPLGLWCARRPRTLVAGLWGSRLIWRGHPWTISGTG